ncbi:MAG: hypothetical protein ACI9VR_004269 [Cognaticolwellia sp.]|jgi:hypothetical protein
MKRYWLLLLIPMMGCGNCSEEEGSAQVTQVIEPGAPVAAVIDSALGVGQVEIGVRLINAYGIAVPADRGQVQLAVAGSDVDSGDGIVEIDALGYGSLLASSDVPQALLATVLSAPEGAQAGATGTSWIVSADIPETGFYPAWAVELEPNFLHAVDQGMILAQGSQVYWQDGLPTSPPVLVAEMPTDVQGLAAADFDRDGVEDAVLWTYDEVVLLRGRYDGGFSWGAGYTVPGQSVRGVGVGDANLDGIQDMVVAYGTEESGGFEVLIGSGAWTFQAETPLSVPEDIWSVALCQLNDDGRPDVALMVADENSLGKVLRFGPDTAGNWANNANDLAGGSLANPLGRGSRLLDCSDLKGTPATEELVAIGPTDDPQRPLVWYSFEGGTTTEFKLQYAGYEIALGDVTGDGVDDVVLSERDSNQIRVLTWQADQGNFLNDAVVAVPMGGPIGVNDVDGDGAADILVTSNVMALYPGEIDEEGRWALVQDDFTVYGVSDVGSQTSADLDGDGLPEHVAVRFFDGSTVLQVFTWELEDGVPKLVSPALSRSSVDGGSNASVAEGLDIAVCENTVYTLVQDSGQYLYRMETAANGEITNVSSVAVSGSVVACGEIGEIAAIVSDELGVWVGYDTYLVEVDSGDVGSSVGDIAMADTTGNGDSLEFCDAPDCNLHAADLDGDGVDELLRGGSAPSALGWGVELDFDQPGLVSTLDWDGDGRLDVAVTDTELERVAIYRSLERSYAPPIILHGVRDLDGPAQSADLDGDGAAELLLRVLDGNLMRAPGTLP